MIARKHFTQETATKGQDRAFSPKSRASGNCSRALSVYLCRAAAATPRCGYCQMRCLVMLMDRTHRPMHELVPPHREQHARERVNRSKPAGKAAHNGGQINYRSNPTEP